MVVRNEPVEIATLFEADETAWLDEMSQRAVAGDVDGLDLEHLGEYLSDMAKRDRREVVSRMTVLLAHMLKWDHQPDRRSAGWEITIRAQRRELTQLLESRVLRVHAMDELERIFGWAIEDAASETGLPGEAFGTECPYSLERILDDE